MPYKRKTFRKKTNGLKKKIRKTVRRTSRMNKIFLKKGGCACNSPLFKGGRIDPPSFDKVPISKFYGQNDFQNDPQYQQIGSRTEPNM